MTVVSFFFLPRFSFPYTDNSHKNRRSKGTIFILCYHVYPFQNIQRFICSFTSERVTFLFSILAHVTAMFLLYNITLLLEIRIWLKLNFFLLVILIYVFSFPQRDGALEFAFFFIILLLLQTKWLLSELGKPMLPTYVLKIKATSGNSNT